MHTIWSPDLSAARGPKYAALAASIRSAVRDGTLDEGARLPPVRQLADTMGVTPGTVARAYAELTGEGVLTAAVGRGTFVAPSGRDDPPEPYLVAATEAGDVNLRTALVPDVGQGPIIAEALRRAARDDGWTAYPDAAGDLPLARAVLDWCAEAEIGPAEPAQVVPTLGAQHALTVVMQAALRGTRPRVVVDELAYPGFRHAAALARAEVSGLPWDDDGPIPDAFEAACRLGGVQLYCTSAEVNNPTTRRTAPARRAEIVAVARRHDVQILDDDCFISGAPESPLYRGLAPERVWHVGSLSKRLSPMLRFGYLVAPEGRGRDARIALQHQAFGLPRPVTDTVLDLLRTGAAAEIKSRVREANRVAVALAREAFAAVELETRDEVPLVWMRMPRGWRASTFAAAAKAQGVLVKPADLFALPDGRAPNRVRIALNGAVERGVYVGALARLAALLAQTPLDLEI